MGRCGILNGSFEEVADGGDVPAHWNRVLHPGGEGGFDTGDSAHGARSYRFAVSPGGPGGGYLESGFFAANPLSSAPVRFACKASSPGVRAACVLLCYDREKRLLGEREIYSSVSNPAAWGLVVVTNVAGLFAGTEYARLRLAAGGGAAGTVWFDAVDVEGSPAPVNAAEAVEQEEAKTRSRVFADVGRPWDISIPAGGKISWLAVGIELRGNSWSDEMGAGFCRAIGRFRVGDRFSTEEAGPLRDGWGAPRYPVLNVERLRGTQRLRFQLRAEPGGERPVSLRSPASAGKFFFPDERLVDAAAGTVAFGRPAGPGERKGEAEGG